MSFLRKLLDSEYKELKKFENIANEIVKLEDKYATLSDEALKHKTEEFKERLALGESLNDILVEAFAVVREV